MKPKPLSKDQILSAISRTRSNRAAARYLSVSFPHYRKWAKLYKDEATGKDLFELHKNQAGTGIPKFLPNKGFKGGVSLQDILEGKVTPDSFTPSKLKDKLIVEGYLEECCKECGFSERRVLDYRMPLLLHFKDKNKRNYKLENLELLCYNCYYLHIGDIFNNRQIQGIEDHLTIYKQEEKPDWDLDEYQLKRLKELGLADDDEDKEDDYISRV
jgi:hypothetical protein